MKVDLKYEASAVITLGHEERLVLIAMCSWVKSRTSGSDQIHQLADSLLGSAKIHAEVAADELRQVEREEDL